MKEGCFCGRRGEITDRDPILDEAGRWALRCTECGPTDYLEWLQEAAASFSGAKPGASSKSW